MSASSQELLESFDRLPDAEKREVASEIIRRTFVPNLQLDEAELAAVYANFAEEERSLAEEGLEDYQKGLLAEDAR